MGRLIDALTGLASPWLYLVIAGLAAAESAALVGLVVPGELALLVGGFAASQGHVSLPVMIVAATAAAVVGDSIGYELGRHFGPAVRQSRVGRWVGEQRWSKAEAFIDRRGGSAVLLGRWVGLLRALVPGVAGMTRMPYRRFLAWNVAGALVWAPGVVTAGYLAGDSFRRVEKWLGRASLLLLAVVMTGVVIWHVAKWAAAHREAVLAFSRRVRDSAPVRRSTAIVQPIIEPAVTRLRPHAAFLVVLAPALVVIGVAGVGLAATFDAVTGTEDVARLDRPVAAWFDAHRTAGLTSVIRTVSTVGGGTGTLVVVALVSAVGWFRQRSARPALVMGVSLGGAVVLSQVIKHLTNRARPVSPAQVFEGFAFPSGHTSAAVATWGALAFLASADRSWRQQVAIWTAAISAGAAVGFSRAYLGAHWFTDVLGGWLLGTAWLAFVLAAALAVDHRRRILAGSMDDVTPEPDRRTLLDGPLVRAVTGASVGFGLLATTALTTVVVAARFPHVPESALVLLWLTGSLAAGAVTRQVDPRVRVRLATVGLAALGVVATASQGLPPTPEFLAWLGAGAIAFASTAPSWTARSPVRRRLGAVAMSALLAATAVSPAGAWFAGVRRTTPTQAQVNTGGIDLAISTHQWLASQGMVILAADGHDTVASFLATPDPTAPEATDPTTGAPLGTPNTYGWRLLKGAADADGVLYPQIRDHLHNHWTHRGRQYVVGASAASNAEKAFDEAVRLWNTGDRGNAVYWLGAALHLVQDSCVPQHGWFGIGVYHHDYETWVNDNQDALAVADGGIYQTDFRVNGGHGGDDWSSAHPRGWADECAHRAFENLPAASHPYPQTPSPTDKQWATAPHIAASQQLSAGFIVFFFDTVNGP